MVKGKVTALPIKVIIHVKDVDIFQVYPLAIYPICKDGILAARSARKNPTGWSVRLVISSYFIDHRSYYVLVDVSGCRQNSEFHLGETVVGQIFWRNLTPLKQLPGAFVG